MIIINIEQKPNTTPHKKSGINSYNLVTPSLTTNIL
jgi:hypothetical protein